MKGAVESCQLVLQRTEPYTLKPLNPIQSDRKTVTLSIYYKPQIEPLMANRRPSYKYRVCRCRASHNEVNEAIWIMDYFT